MAARPVATHGYHPGAEDSDVVGNDHLDDVWGDDDADSAPTTAPAILTTTTTSTTSPNSSQPPPRPHQHSHPSDVPRLQQEHTTAGYRDGVTVAKASSVQAGFDEGFGLGATVGAHAGRLLGLLEGLAAAVQKMTSDDPSAPLPAESERLSSLLNDARAELSVQSVFSEEFWAPDGTWKYDVPELAAGEEDTAVVFADVAAAHPSLKKWDAVVRAEAERYGLLWDVALPEEEEEEEGEGVKSAAVAKRGIKVVAQSKEQFAW
ncbi:hypothetical protein B0T19DRAFT_436778 [Cercophora scortea]|uniref:Protein YAE1 n=1 Tax=Cercophora scortea TaxID=314031 RepID=A0AAE0J326_9PEZI|nr:hypothetical protein B0T19DRAFT_436778 [Cercophora scortea]